MQIAASHVHFQRVAEKTVKNIKGAVFINVDLCPHKLGIRILRTNEIPPIVAFTTDDWMN